MRSSAWFSRRSVERSQQAFARLGVVLSQQAFARLSIVLFTFALFVGGAARAALLDGIAARVNKRLVTVQDARFFRAIHRFVAGQADPLALEEGEALRKTVQKMIFEEMVLEEMKSLKVEAGPKSDALTKVKAARTKARESEWNQILKRFSKREDEAVELIYRSSEVERFIQKKVETMTPIITSTEVERYYQQNQGRLKGEDLESLRPNITLLLKKQKMEKGLEEWIRFLRDKYGVANYLEG